MGEGIGEQKMEELVPAKQVYEETKGADSRDKEKHNGRSDQ